MNPISAAILEQQNIIAEAERKISQVVEECPHTDATVRHDSNTGNYDPMDNTYFRYTSCPDCGLLISEILESGSDVWKVMSRSVAKLK